MTQHELNEWYKYLKIEKDLQAGDPLTQKAKDKKQALDLKSWAANHNANLKVKNGKKR